MELRIAEDDEVLVRGPLIFLGYFTEEATIEPDVDVDGWFATGDLGALDADGFLTITDRKKDLIITSGGKNIAPSRAEGLVRTHPLIGCVAVIGDGRPYVTALVTLDEEAAPAWAAARGIEATGPSALAAHPEVLTAVEATIARANEQLSRPEQIKAYRVVDRPWTPETGELTPTLKLKRRVIEKVHAAEIAELYTDGS